MDTTQYVALCPACSARLPVNDSHMKIADGNIRCGKCNTAFYAPDNLLRGFYTPEIQQKVSASQQLTFDLDVNDNDNEGNDNERFQRTNNHQESADTPQTPEHQQRVESEMPPSVMDAVATSSQKEDQSTVYGENEQIIHHEPSSSRQRRKKGKRSALYRDNTTGLSKKWIWIPAIILVLVMLLFQLLIVNASAWSRHPLMRGIYSQICVVGLCKLSVDMEPVSLNIEVAGYRRFDDGRYEIKVLLTNWAYYSQTLPVIELSFVDIVEKEKFSKLFRPEHYLSEQHQNKVHIAPEEQFDFILLIDDLVAEKKHLFPRLKLISY